jgi:hypothetical protein
MLTQILWWSCNALIGSLLLRAAQERFFTKYLAFYLYLSHVLLLAFIRFYLYVFKPSSYRSFYWYTEFVSVAIGYCVIWEIYQQALAPYSGTLRMARYLVLGIFCAVVGNSLINGLTGSVWGPAQTVMDLERNLRTVQTALLVVVLGILSYYLIPIGRNLMGIIFGYGFFIGVGVINMTLRSHLGDSFQIWWRYFQSSAYLITLLIWSATLWSYEPNPAPNTDVRIEHDYELLSERTSLALGKARSFILRGIR